MKLLVDGVAFQLARSSVKQAWQSLLLALADVADLEILLLDRGQCPDLKGIRRIDFPSYSGTYTAADSFLVDRFCDHYGADVFVSTQSTTPIMTPSVLILNETMSDFSECGERAALERQIAIAHADVLLLGSETLHAQLIRQSPRPDADVIVAHPGRDWQNFAQILYGFLKRARDGRQSPPSIAFFERWKRLRALQSDVDVGL